MRVSAGSACAANSNVTGPTPMRSPARSALGFSMVAPFSSVPLAEPLSSRIHAAPCRSMRAWVRETPASLSTTSFSAPRPMVTRSASNWNFCPRPFPSAIVNTKGIYTALDARSWGGRGGASSPLVEAAQPPDLEGRGTGRAIIGALSTPIQKLPPKKTW